MPIRVRAPRLTAWERLYRTPTITSSTRVTETAIHHYLYPPSQPLREGVQPTPTSYPNSLEWTLQSEYDHERHFLFSKPDIYYRR